MPAAFDHLVFAASTLEEGLDWFEAGTGLRLPAGGKHDLMGTHNCVAALDQHSYIELIAIDPGAANPGRARWFGLDDPSVQADLSEGPRPLTWVARTPDLEATLGRLKSVGLDGGRPLPMSRGALSWHFGARDDGSLMEKGVFPALIQWPAVNDGSQNAHPARNMQTSGLVLRKLHLSHPDPAYLKTALEALELVSLTEIAEIQAGPHGIQFALTTPDGVNITL